MRAPGGWNPGLERELLLGDIGRAPLPADDKAELTAAVSAVFQRAQPDFDQVQAVRQDLEARIQVAHAADPLSTERGMVANAITAIWDRHVTPEQSRYAAIFQLMSEDQAAQFHTVVAGLGADDRGHGNWLLGSVVDRGAAPLIVDAPWFEDLKIADAVAMDALGYETALKLNETQQFVQQCLAKVAQAQDTEALLAMFEGEIIELGQRLGFME